MQRKGKACAFAMCATLGAKLKGASLIIGLDLSEQRLSVARQFGANVTIDMKDGDPTRAIKHLTDGRGVDVAIEALGRQETFESALRRSVPAERSPASACIRATWSPRTRRSTPAWAIRRSSRRCARAGKNGCVA